MELVERTIDTVLADTVRRFGQKIGLIYQGNRYTWEEVDLLSDWLASRLERQGVVRGDHVGLWGENTAAWVVAFLAVQKLGAVAALLNFNYQQRELEQVMRLGRIQWLCYGSTGALDRDPALLEKASGRFGDSYRGGMDIREEILGLRQTLRQIQPSPARPHAPLDSSSLACMLYTTGTSSTPKCVLHRHFSLVNNAILTAERVHMDTEDRICVSQPLFHVFGLVTSLLGGICCGATLCILSHFGSEDILRCVQDCRCTILNGVPTNFIRMIANPNFPNYRTDSLRLSIIGGADISATQLDDIQQAIPTTHIMRNYGLTEGCNLCNSEYSDSPGVVSRSVGRPYPHIELAIQDPKRRVFLPAGERGEIVVRGYSIMQGYFEPEGCGQNGQTLDQDGWLHTGDLGVIGEDGHVSIVGRLKNIIKRGGENIAPAEVSREILRYEPVLDALVIGAPHPVLGEEVVACLMLKEPQDYEEGELRSMLGVRLARYKIPAFFLLYEKFPLKPSGKIDMLALQEDVYGKVRELHRGDPRYYAVPQPRKA